MKLPSRSERGRVLGSLVGVGVALPFVGTMSGTLLRHVVQISPMVLVSTLLVRSPRTGANAAVPVFVFWALVVALIWAYLLGISSIANGQYSLSE